MAEPFLQMHLILTRISSVFMGMNCVLFLFCVYVLWGQRSRSRRFLLLSSIVQFCLCLAQTVLFIVCIDVALSNHVRGEAFYFLQHRGYTLPCYIIYMLNNIIEGSLMIWRVYILYNHNIKVCIPAILLLVLEVGFSAYTLRGAASLHIPITAVHVHYLVTWSLIVAVNVCATTLICHRLWTARQSAMAILSASKYKSTILVVVECGALVTVCTVAMLVLHSVIHPVGISGQGITTQAATMAPLLIIARHGLLSREDDHPARVQIPLRISVVRTEETHVDTPVEFARKKRGLLSDPMPVVPSGDYSKPFSDV